MEGAEFPECSALITLLCKSFLLTVSKSQITKGIDWPHEAVALTK